MIWPCFFIVHLTINDISKKQQEASESMQRGLDAHKAKKTDLNKSKDSVPKYSY